MSIPDKNTPSSPLERLTVQQSRFVLVRHIGFSLFCAAFGVYLLYQRNFWLAALMFFCVLIQVLVLPALWKQHLIVKQGTEVYIRTAHATPVLFSVSLFFTGLLTLIVAIASAGSYFFGYLMIPSVVVRLVLILVNLGLWFIVLFIWYRLLTAKQEQPLSQQVNEQTEGVWPPPPQTQPSEAQKDSED